MKFENLSQDVIKKSIDMMIACNPDVPMSRADWFEYIEENYNITIDKFTGGVYLEPR